MEYVYMQPITRNTVVSTSLATIVAVAWAMWLFMGDLQGYMNQIVSNTMAIQSLAKAVEVGRVSDEIGDLRREKRELKRALRKDPENDLIMDQLEDIEDSIENKTIIKACILSNQQDCE